MRMFCRAQIISGIQILIFNAPLEMQWGWVEMPGAVFLGEALSQIFVKKEVRGSAMAAYPGM